jgi:hypothetical protein
MEIETRIPISIDLGTERWPTIARHKGGVYKIDIDHHTGPEHAVEQGLPTAILEFVMGHFDDHAGTRDEAVAEFRARYAVVRAAIETFADAAPSTSFAQLCGQLDLIVGDGWQDAAAAAVVNPFERPRGQKLHSAIHYTLSIALEVFPRLVTEVLVQHTTNETSRDRSLQAVDVGSRATARLAGPNGTADVDAAKLCGYIALLYMQVAARYDGGQDGEKRLMKNLTQALSRVPWWVIREDLTPAEWAWLSGNHAAIIDEMQKAYNPGNLQPRKKIKNAAPRSWGDQNQKDALLMPPHVRPLLDNALVKKKPNDDPSDTFGEMTVVRESEPVGPPAKAGRSRMKGYAMELRQRPGGGNDLEMLQWLSVGLLETDRNLHGTDAAAVAPPSATTKDDLATKAPARKPTRTVRSVSN